MNFSNLKFPTSSASSTTDDKTKNSMNYFTSSISSAASQISVAASAAASQVMGEVECHICKEKISKANVTIGVSTYQRCVVCGTNECCKKCIKKYEAADPIPSRIKHADFRDSTKADWVCIHCEPLVSKTFMEDFKKLFLEYLDGNIDSYFKNTELMIPLPSFSIFLVGGLT